MQESAVNQPAVDQSVLEKIWKDMTGEGGRGEERRRMEEEESRVRPRGFNCWWRLLASCSALLRPNLNSCGRGGRYLG